MEVPGSLLGTKAFMALERQGKVLSKDKRFDRRFFVLPGPPPSPVHHQTAAVENLQALRDPSCPNPRSGTPVSLMPSAQS